MQDVHKADLLQLVLTLLRTFREGGGGGGGDRKHIKFSPATEDVSVPTGQLHDELVGVETSAQCYQQVDAGCKKLL